MIEQPKGGDGEAAWRQYAGELRKRLQEAKERARASQRRLELCAIDKSSLMRAKRRDGRTLDELERELLAGDFPAAVDRIMRRRAFMNAAARRNSTD